MTDTQQLVNSIIAGIQEKKGSKIVVADLSKLSPILSFAKGDQIPKLMPLQVHLKTT